MINLPKLGDANLSGKRVMIRMDLDVPFDKNREEFVVRDDSRIKNCIPAIKEVLNKGASQVLLLGHLGKYEGEERNVSTSFLRKKFSSLLGEEVTFVEGMPPATVPEGKVILLDNVRLHEGEEKNDDEFAKALANLADFYVNEAFATSHRAHASIVSIPKILPHAAGLRFAGEVDKLSGILENPKRPLVAIISGIKKDKLEYMENFKAVADKILVGGRLPEYLGDEYEDPKVMVAHLNPDKEDITLHSVEAFEKEIAGAGTVVLAGVIGKYEEEGHRLGTKRVFEAIAKSGAYKVVGGGDSEAALSMFGLTDKFDWISTGGGAMLEFLSKRTLPGIEALVG